MPPRDMEPRPRSAPPGIDPEDYDAIREAVMETRRGRWFLDEYASRLRRAETQQLQDGMRRLETVLAANHDEVMSRLAAALGAATEAPVPAAPPVETEAEMRLTQRHMQYFRADEDLFEPAPEAEAAQAPAPRLIDRLPPEVEAAPPRRRIVITRRKPGEPFEVPLAEELPKAS